MPMPGCWRAGGPPASSWPRIQRGRGPTTIASLTRDNQRVLIVDYEDHEQEWRGRIENCGGDLSQVYLVAPFSQRWKSKGKTILDHAEALSALARELSITFIVIDSAMMAVP